MVMKRSAIYFCFCLAQVLLFSVFPYSTERQQDDFSERVKVLLREIGNQLLLSDNDSTSLVLPVKKTEDSKYRLSFQNQLAIVPDSLVSIVKHNFQKLELPKHYRIEVVKCNDNLVVYSYQMSADAESTIIPCLGRLLPRDCYSIELYFIKKDSYGFSEKNIAYSLIAMSFGVLAFFFFKRKKSSIEDAHKGRFIKVGSFHFYAEQNKLIKKKIEISLSKKECELLEIFVANKNQIVKRDELTKRVWEDNGVFVGRSLDTYISKLRKKLKPDDSIRLINVHGVGYKLEVS